MQGRELRHTRAACGEAGARRLPAPAQLGGVAEQQGSSTGGGGCTKRKRAFTPAGIITPPSLFVSAACGGTPSGLSSSPASSRSFLCGASSLRRHRSPMRQSRPLTTEAGWHGSPCPYPLTSSPRTGTDTHHKYPLLRVRPAQRLKHDKLLFSAGLHRPGDLCCHARIGFNATGGGRASLLKQARRSAGAGKALDKGECGERRGAVAVHHLRPAVGF